MIDHLFPTPLDYWSSFFVGWSNILIYDGTWTKIMPLKSSHFFERFLHTTFSNSYNGILALSCLKGLWHSNSPLHGYMLFRILRGDSIVWLNSFLISQLNWICNVFWFKNIIKISLILNIDFKNSNVLFKIWDLGCKFKFKILTKFFLRFILFYFKCQKNYSGWY
jgi:hypothetical protein